jgi:hypothetical protein
LYGISIDNTDLITIIANDTIWCVLLKKLNIFSIIKQPILHVFNLFIDVALLGGPSPQEGYLYALNPVTKIFGPVCDDYFDNNAVSTIMTIKHS